MMDDCVCVYVCVCSPLSSGTSQYEREKGAVFNLTDPGQGRLSHMPNIRALSNFLSVDFNV